MDGILNLRAYSKWGLTGTPHLGSVRAVANVASMFGVDFLGVSKEEARLPRIMHDFAEQNVAALSENPKFADSFKWYGPEDEFNFDKDTLRITPHLNCVCCGSELLRPNTTDSTKEGQEEYCLEAGSASRSSGEDFKSPENNRNFAGCSASALTTFLPAREIREYKNPDLRKRLRCTNCGTRNFKPGTVKTVERPLYPKTTGCQQELVSSHSLSIGNLHADAGWGSGVYDVTKLESYSQNNGSMNHHHHHGGGCEGGGGCVSS